MAIPLASQHLDGLSAPSVTSSAQDRPLSWYQALYGQHREEEMALLAYLELCRDHPEVAASPHERLLQAIGEPVLLDTSHDERLSRIFSNRIIRTGRVPIFPVRAPTELSAKWPYVSTDSSDPPCNRSATARSPRHWLDTKRGSRL